MTDRTLAHDVVEAPLAPGGTVDIHITSGDLRVTGTDADRVVVRTRDGRPFADDVVVTADEGLVRVRDGERGLHLGPLSLRTRGIPDLDIQVPRTARVQLRTVSGDVEAQGVGAWSRWASASGDLHLAIAGGEVQLETMSGDAVLEASGTVAIGARTVSGDLRIRAPRVEALDAATTSGDVRIEAALADGRRHAVSSVSGDVVIATSSAVRVEGQTIAGDIVARGPHHAEGSRTRRVLVVGKGTAIVSVRTTSGDVRLQVVEGAPAPSPVPPVPPAAPEPPMAPVPPVAPVAPVPPQPPATPVPPVPPEAPGRGLVAGADDVPDVAETDVAELADVAPGTPGVRPATDEDTQAWALDAGWSAGPSATDRREAARLDILRALERGEIDIDGASRRLEALEDAGPRSFRGWC